MRRMLVLAILGVALVGLLPAAQGASSKVKLVSCVNTVQTNEPGELNRCKDGRSLRYDYMEVTDSAVYTAAEDTGLEGWPVTPDAKLSQGPCYTAYKTADGCTVVSELRPRAMTASPDGRHLYVINSTNGISILEIGANGALTYKGCMGAVGGEGACSKRFPSDGSGIFQLRVSPDGERLYGLDYRGAVTFRRSADGSLDYLGCLKLTKSVCAANQHYPFTASHAGIAISPDSRFVYVVGGDTSESYKVKGQIVGVISVLARTDSAPGLKQIQLLKLPVWGVGGTGDRGRGSAAISPDGRHLYATIKHRLVTLTRNKQGGTVRVTRCMSDDSFPDYDTMKCADMFGPGLSATHAVILTRDGRGVALAGYHGISMFKRNPATGALGTTKIGGVILQQACAHTQQRGGPCATDLPSFTSVGPITFSKRGDRLFMTTSQGAVLSSATTPFGGGARATSAASAVDHRLGINNWMVGPTRSSVGEIYRGVELKPLKFAVGLHLLSEHGETEPTTETVRMTLPKGLSWGPRAAWPRTLRGGAPDYWSFTPVSQSCTVQGQVATCQAIGAPGGTQVFGWILDVEAATAGKYTVHGEVVPPTDGRNRVPRGTEAPASADLNLLIGERSGKVVASTITLTRPKPSYVYAAVKVTQGGVPVRASSVTCTMDFPTEKSFGGPRVQKVPKAWLPRFAPLGSVTCLHGFNNARYEGKLMTGATEFTVGKTKVTKKYSVRIGPGSSLLSPKGAVVAKET